MNLSIFSNLTTTSSPISTTIVTTTTTFENSISVDSQDSQPKLTCQQFRERGAAGLQLTGLVLFYMTTSCTVKDDDILSGDGGRGVDSFLISLAEEYFEEAPQIVILYDESWDITQMLVNLGSKTSKAFVTYFLPLDRELSKRVKSRGPEDPSHKVIPKAKAFIIFVKDEIGFTNIYRQTIRFPWWNKRAKLAVLVNEKTGDPTRGILNLLDVEKVYNCIVATEVTTRDVNNELLMSLGNMTQNSTIDENYAQLQIAALDPFPGAGQPKQYYVARWTGTDYSFRLGPLFQEKMDNLRGHTLTAAVFDFPPLVIRTEKPRPWNATKNYTAEYDYTGLEVQIFAEFASIINFTYQFIEPPEGERWGKDTGDNNWNGLIGETQRNADFGFASVFLVDNRESAVDVSTPYDNDKACFAVPRPEALQHWLGLVLPFSWQVWACIFSMAFIAGPIFSMITRPLKQDQTFSVGDGIFYALGSLVATQKPPKAKSSALRAFIISWILFCWMACIIYRVSLILSLTIGPSNFKIDTIRQFINAHLEWGGFKSFLKTFTNSSTGDDEELFDRFIPLTNISAALDRVANDGDFAVFDSRKYLLYAEKGKYFDGYSSAIHVAKECPSSFNVGFMLPVGSPFLERINQVIRRMQNAGLIQYWLDDILFKASLRSPNKDRSTKKNDRSLSIDHLKLCFIIIVCGQFCGFISLIFENIIDRYKIRKEKILEMLQTKIVEVTGRRKRSSVPSAPPPELIVTSEVEPFEGYETPVPEYSAASSVENLQQIDQLYPRIKDIE